ncbi:MAG: hypothetical protein GEV28_05940 [Actinophytocola sp.]|uniref:hypothetical protein n=1 Tax=Actinophytocola sp. TaxID=1872138 RepID=UPI00132C0EFE|nr:hypothetical protein [Actinophytocola sp.]MPZ79954.1 hypothetical protein [Actinophytocola sp.]
MDSGARPRWVREAGLLVAEMAAAYVVVVVVALLFDWASPWVTGLIGPGGVLCGLVFGTVARRRT